MAKIKDLLNKKNNNESLTEEELELLTEYLDDLKVVNDKIAILEKEKIAEELKSKNTSTELETKLQELAEKETKLKELMEKQSSLEDELKKATDLKALQEKIEKEREKETKLALEKKLEEDRKKLEEDNIKKLTEKDNQIKELMDKYNELNNATKVMEFKSSIAHEKSEKPYLADKLNKLIEDITTENLDEKRYVFNFLLNSVNHEEEMVAYKNKISAGSSIFQGIKDTKADVGSVDDFEEFLKRNPNLR